jgi:hypothetical protein
MMGGSWGGGSLSFCTVHACLRQRRQAEKRKPPTVSPARILCSARTTGGMATSSNQPKALKTMLPLVDACTTDLEHLRSLLEHQLRLVSRSFSALSAVRSQLASGEFNAVEAAETIATVQRHLKSE